MPNDESESDLDGLLPELLGIQEAIKDLEAKKTAIEERIMIGLFGSPYSLSAAPATTGEEELTEHPDVAAKQTPRLVESFEKERAAAQFAAAVMDAVVKYFAAAEEQILSETGKIHAALRQEIEEELRLDRESSVRPLSAQLERQREELSSLRALVNATVERLDRHSEVIRSVRNLQVRHTDALREVTEALKRLAASEV